MHTSRNLWYVSLVPIACFEDGGASVMRGKVECHQSFAQFIVHLFEWVI